MATAQSPAGGRRLPLLSATARDLAEKGNSEAGPLPSWVTPPMRPRLDGLGAAPQTDAVTGPAAFAAGRRCSPCQRRGRLVGSRMSSFSSPRALTGIRNGPPTTTGVYRYSRNPQYLECLGYLLVLIGAALARRSGVALASAGALAAVYVAWVSAEEAHLTGLHGTHTPTTCAEPAAGGAKDDGAPADRMGPRPNACRAAVPIAWPREGAREGSLREPPVSARLGRIRHCGATFAPWCVRCHSRLTRR